MAEFTKRKKRQNDWLKLHFAGVVLEKPTNLPDFTFETDLVLTVHGLQLFGPERLRFDIEIQLGRSPANRVNCYS